MQHCEDCGTKISDGFCPNCEEEAYIHDVQGEWPPDMILSDEFKKQVEEQREKAKERKERLIPSRDLEMSVAMIYKLSFFRPAVCQ